jgi:hypothetical protein
VNDKILTYLEQLSTNFRKSMVWKEMRATPPTLFPLANYGFAPPG